MIDYELPMEFWTRGEIIEDIRLRIIHAPDIIGTDTRALPPVDWTRVEQERHEQEEWENQFEENVKKESLASRFVKKLSGQ